MGKIMTVRELLGGNTTGPEYEASARSLFGTRVLIHRFSGSVEPEERDYEGLAGRLSAPFANLQGLLGLYLAPGQPYVRGYDGAAAKTSVVSSDTVNLLADDEVELLDGQFSR